MAPFDECCVLIPAATLEDFPSNAADFDARSMLAGWTVLWHPRLLAQSEQLPTWYRADSPPDVDGPRVVVVPTLSGDQIPRGYEAKCRKNPDCCWVSGEDREQMLQILKLDELPILKWENRSISVQDFFAAGFVSLQIQVMTRRLRYTSNLDEIHLQGRVVAAAKAFVNGDAEATAEALHDVFDCLSEERDHYFSSDPHLIDLTLLTPSTLDTFVDQQLAAILQSPADANPADDSVHPTPCNVLIDHDVAMALKKTDGEQYREFCASICGGQIGWAGGDPDPTYCLDAMSLDQADQAIAAGHKLASEAIGSSPTVYSRFSGATPADVTPAIARMGYQGMIPIDFSRGSGFGDEAKVIRQGGGAEIQALTAKPIDAGSDASFLNLGARLGESIDSGEIATALLVHWPGNECESFRDLKTAASWSLALGKFWKLEDYFTAGEHPYHHGSARAVSPNACSLLTDSVQQQVANPISRQATAFADCVRGETAGLLRGMVDLVAGKPDQHSHGDLTQLASQFARSSGATPLSGNTAQKVTSMLCVNPQGCGCRDLLRLDGNPPAAAKHIYGASAEGSASMVSIDIPAYGFARAEVGSSSGKQGSLWGRLFSPRKEIADGTALRNEFMEVSISPQTGGIQGVYSGQTRGNRFSMRLVRVTSEAGEAGEDAAHMVADQVRVVSSSESAGEIEARGKLLDADSKVIAAYSLVYRLSRGSRQIQVSGSLTSESEFQGDPWRNYLGLRVAVSSEAAIVRLLVRDKIHRSRSQRMVSPLGLVIDEAERQTLISTAGLAFHRKVGDRFIDTLLVVEGEACEIFKLSYGFDVPAPVATAKAFITGSLQVPVEKPQSLPPRGWIAFASPPDVMITHLQIRQREDGRLAATIRAIQTRSQSANITLRFCRDVQFASILDGSHNDPWNLPIESPAGEDEAKQSSGIKCSGDSIRFAAGSHQVTDLVVVFAD